MKWTKKISIGTLSLIAFLSSCGPSGTTSAETEQKVEAGSAFCLDWQLLTRYRYDADDVRTHGRALDDKAINTLLAKIDPDDWEKGRDDTVVPEAIDARFVLDVKIANGRTYSIIASQFFTCSTSEGRCKKTPTAFLEFECDDN